MDEDGGAEAEAARRVGRAHAQSGRMMVAVLVLDMEMAVEGEGVAVVVVAPAALVPPLRLVEGFGDAACDFTRSCSGERVCIAGSSV